MHTPFDWLRGARSGVELLALLRLMEDEPGQFVPSTSAAGPITLGPVPNALATPCSRCWFYPPAPQRSLCPLCQQVRARTRGLVGLVRDALVMWGYVNRVPARFRRRIGSHDENLLGVYVHDDQHFLLLLPSRRLLPWLQELLLYHGPELKGHLQLFPTLGANQDGLGMGDILCQAVRHERYFALDRLRIRFYTDPFQPLRPHEADRNGLLTHEAGDLLSLLEMASIFRSILKPEEQAILYELLIGAQEGEEQFYWGRLMGVLNQRGRDLLDAWNVRHWPAPRVKFFYELTHYVDYRPAD